MNNELLEKEISNNINCILLDIDHTLTTDTEEIPNEITEFFTKIKEKYHIILITGRTNSYAVEKSKICNASSIVISDNGSVIYNYEKDKVLYSNFFEPNMVNTIWEISQKYNIDCVLNTVYRRYRNHVYMNEKYLKNNNIGITSIDELKDNVTQIVLFSNNELEYTNCLKDINKLEKIEICNRGKENDGRYFADLNVAGTSKGKAITELNKFLNIKKENIICFGDSMNDLSMFEQSGIKVAVKNACKSLKDIADYITEFSNNENGVVEFLKAFFYKNS